MTDDEESLDESFSTVLHRLHAWWSAPPLPPRTLRNVKWGAQDLSRLVGRLRHKGSNLEIEFESTEGAIPDRDTLGGFGGQALTGDTDDGWRFAARRAFYVQWSVRSGQGASVKLLVRCWDWTLSIPSAGSQFWVGELTAQIASQMGNLSLTTGTPESLEKFSFSRGHYLLTGSTNRYALLQGEKHQDQWLLVAQESSPGTVAHDRVQRDLDAMAVAFGATLNVTELWSVDEDLNVHSVIGTFGRRANRVMRHQSPVPSSASDDAALPVVFFESLSRHEGDRLARDDRLTSDAAQLTLAWWYYLESLAEESSNAALAKIALAAIVSARYLLGDDTVLAKDLDVFQAWLVANAEAVPALERDDRAGLLTTQLAEAYDARPSTLLELAMSKAGIEFLPELRDAFGNAELCLQGREPSQNGFYERFACVRAIFAALVSRAIGYNGRLAGWRRAEPYAFYPAADDAWTGADPLVTATFYSAHVSEPVGEIASLWPHVAVPEIPRSGLLSLLARHAAGLARVTDGNVFAQLSPLPLEGANEERRYELALRASRRPTAKVTLFMAHQSGDSVIIEGWEDRVVLRSAADVQAFLASVADAVETRVSIERLMLASLETMLDEEA
jgi:hypothetical protein